MKDSIKAALCPSLYYLTSVVLLVAGCAEEGQPGDGYLQAGDTDSDGEEDELEDRSDPRAAALPSSDSKFPEDEDWEVTPVQLDEVPLATEAEIAEQDISSMTTEDWEEAYINALNDPLWYAEDGERFDALFIDESGVVYGRRGPGKNRPQPSKSNGFGSFEGGTTSDAATHSAALGFAGSSPQDVSENNHSPFGGFLAPWETPEPEPNYVGTDYWNDTRLRVSSNDALTSYPARTIGALSGNGNVGSGGCTGTKVGPRSILTASHCIFTASGSLTTTGFFNPGQRNSSALNGSHQWSGVFLRDWRIGRRFDYAVLRGPNTSAFVSLGWLGVQWWNSASSYQGKSSIINGYPAGPNHSAGAITVQRCNASPRTDKRCDGWMYGDQTTLNSSLYNLYEDNTLAFYNDVSKGMSGSAIRTSSSVITGVAAACPTETSSAVCYGPRFRTSMWDDVCGQIAATTSSHGTHALCN